MNNISCVICDESVEIIHLVKDACELFRDEQAISLFELVDEGSERKLSRFFQELKTNQELLNWEVNLKKDSDIQTFFLSGLVWMDKYVIQFSTEKIEQFEFPNQSKPLDIDDKNFVYRGTGTLPKDYDEISRLNNELIDIQRELTKKNLQLEKLNERLEWLATIDPLTGLFNRRSILIRAEREFDRAPREGQVFGLAIMDLDDFKHINDTYGHQIGDKALMTFADCLKESTRHYESAGRLGGDEFMVYFSMDKKRRFPFILNRILRKIENAVINVDNEIELRLKVSIGGVYVEPKKASRFDLTETINQTDKMLYQAKNNENKSIMISAVR